MRLKILEGGFGLTGRIQLAIIQAVSGRVPGAAAVAAYRKDFFGREFFGLAHDVLRGDSLWTAHERELFAAFVSHLNACRY